jgi:hypothetical protein
VILWIFAAVVLLGAAVGGGLYYLQQQEHADEEDGEAPDPEQPADEGDDADGGVVGDLDAVEIRSTIIGGLEWVIDAVAGTQAKRTRLRIGGAIALGLTVVAAFAATALLLNGLFAGVAFIGTLILGAGVPLAGVAILKDGFPLGGAVAPLLAILGQYVLGKGAVVRRQDGGYEWHRLADTAQGYAVQLDDGTVLNITGDRGDLYRFGGRPLAILEAKGRNVEQYTVREEPPETAAESTREVRAGMDVHHPERLRDDTFLISLKQLAQPAAGSAGPHLVQRGRAKALEEAGGEQAIGTFWLMIATALLAVIGFVLGFGMLML